MNQLTYFRAGDYLLPGIKLSDPLDAPPLGRYGRMHKEYLREHKPILYSQLLLSERLYPLCREIDEAAKTRLSAIPDRETAPRNIPPLHFTMLMPPTSSCTKPRKNILTSKGSKASCQAWIPSKLNGGNSRRRSVSFTTATRNSASVTARSPPRNTISTELLIFRRKNWNANGKTERNHMSGDNKKQTPTAASRTGRQRSVRRGLGRQHQRTIRAGYIPAPCSPLT